MNKSILREAKGEEMKVHKKNCKCFCTLPNMAYLCNCCTENTGGEL